MTSERETQPVGNLLTAWLSGDQSVVPTASAIDREADTLARVKAGRTELWQKCCPSDLQATNWDHPHLSPYREQIARVLSWNVGGKGLLLSGRTGRGKSRSLFGLLKRLMCDESRDVGVWRAGDWFNQLQLNVNYGRDDAAGFVRACARRPILVLDDLGQEAITRGREDWARSWFFSLLDERLGEKRPMLITTNCTADQMAGTDNRENIKGEPLVRRLLELCEVVKF